MSFGKRARIMNTGRNCMSRFTRWHLLCGAAASVFAAGMIAPPSVQADDIEVFFSVDVPTNAKPNVLFILDTSQSMYTVEAAAPSDSYDPGFPYEGACNADGYYWTMTGQPQPNCGQAGWAAMTQAQFDCPAWRNAVNAGGFSTKTSRVAQKGASDWINLTAQPAQQALPAACVGDTSAAAPDGQPLSWTTKDRGRDVYPSQSYTVYDGNWLNWASQSAGNKYRIDIVREAVGEIIENTQGVKVGLMRYGYDGAREFLLNSPLACLVKPDPDESTLSSNGAPVVFPVTDLDASAVTGFEPSKDARSGETAVRSQLRFQLGLDDNLEVMSWIVDPSKSAQQQQYQVAFGGGGTCPIPLFTPGGRSPIGGAMYEAYLYFAGKQWSQKYGKQAALGSTFGYPSVPQSRLADSEIYKSPIVDSCAKNFIILLSDGTTEQDNDVDGPIQQLPGFSSAVGRSCDTDSYLANGTPPPSQCVDDIAEYLLETDLRPNNVVPGLNNVITYTVGFKLGTDAAANAARELLRETATRGGGQFFEAGSAVELKDKLGQITREILTHNTSFSAPAVTVNAFNRTQNLNDLYMSLFRPAFNYRWQGNIKKYVLDPLDGDILDAAGRPAVDPGSGFFFSTARSFWSASADGSDVTAGGASGFLEYDTRTMYTTNGTTTVELDSGTANVTASELGIQTGDYIRSGVSGSGDLTATNLLEWFYGKDIADADGNTVTAESRYEMGDPLHAKPVSVIYGAVGSTEAERLQDDALYVVTNDGVLHAFDPDSDDPAELWAFVPRTQLGRVRDLYYNRILTQPEDRGYGLDANIRVLRIDNDRDGIIEPTQWVDVDGDSVHDTDENIEYDRVYLFFGQRRGGTNYYAFDVTNKNSPRLMWERSYTSAGAGQSWSMPVTAKVRIDTTVHNVLVFGGGYDPDEDTIGPLDEDDQGVGIYMVDVLTGNLLWRAGSDSGANLQITSMKHAVPGDVRVIDLTGDGYADRMYAADLGGRVWRFDIFNGKEASGSEGDRLVEGGMLASLGNAEQTDPKTVSNTIRFFYAPDPALITQPGPTFINVAIGSGHRELPVSDTTVQNWMFSVRDYKVLTPLMSSGYKDSCTGVNTPCHEIVYEDGLEDLTALVGDAATVAVPIGSKGWKLALEEDGEKVLAEARTFQSNVFFTTYSPVFQGLTTDTCGQKFGLNKLYVVNAFDARPFYNYDAETGEATTDRSTDLAQGSISPEVVFVFPTPPNTDPNNPEPAVPPVCLVGLEKCGFGVTNPPVRTYWRQRGAN
jgi:type IV pilus assembly protein PilY1